MGKRPFCFLLLMLFTACTTDPALSGPRLVQDVTVTPITPEAARILSPTPSPTPLALPVSTTEMESPLEVATVNVDFILVTPTMPPSKTPTPTLTPTYTITPSLTLTPTPTVTATTIFVPTAVAAQFTPLPPNPQSAPQQQPPQQQPVQPAVSCSMQWFFTQPRPATCPSGPPLTSAAALEQFQQGYMIWIGEQNAIYVIYDSQTQPRWQVFDDTFVDGMMEYDPGWGEGPPYTYQPKRGFGKVWRERGEVRQRIGWSVREWSEPYTAQVQVAADGSIFIQESRGGVFNLIPNGVDWKRYDGYGSY